MQVGFLLHWESLLSTHGDEQGMLEDFIVAIADINQLTFKVDITQNLCCHFTFSLSLSLSLASSPWQRPCRTSLN